MSSTPYGCSFHLEEDMAKVWISIDTWIDRVQWFG